MEFEPQTPSNPASARCQAHLSMPLTQPDRSSIQPLHRPLAALYSHRPELNASGVPRLNRQAHRVDSLALQHFAGFRRKELQGHHQGAFDHRDLARDHVGGPDIATRIDLAVRIGLGEGALAPPRHSRPTTRREGTDRQRQTPGPGSEIGRLASHNDSTAADDPRFPPMTDASGSFCPIQRAEKLID